LKGHRIARMEVAAISVACETTGLHGKTVSR
jgi:hypothetical protein